MIKRLRIKFVCINMAIVTAMLLVIFGMVFHFTRENLEKQSIGMMQTVMDDRLPPIRPGEAPEEIRLPWFRVSRDLWGKDVVFGYYDLSDEETVRNIIRTARESDRQTGILPEYNLRYAKAPGMKYRHYAPKGQITIVEGNSTAVTEKINALVPAPDASEITEYSMTRKKKDAARKIADNVFQRVLKFILNEVKGSILADHLFSIL